MADPYEEAWNQMLLRRQKARQLEQKVCLGLELFLLVSGNLGSSYSHTPSTKSF